MYVFPGSALVLLIQGLWTLLKVCGGGGEVSTGAMPHGRAEKGGGGACPPLFHRTFCANQN